MNKESSDDVSIHVDGSITDDDAPGALSGGAGMRNLFKILEAEEELFFYHP